MITKIVFGGSLLAAVTAHPLRNHSIASRSILQEPVARFENFVTNIQDESWSDSGFDTSLRSIMSLTYEESAVGLQQWASRYRGTATNVAVRKAGDMYMNCVRNGRCGSQILQRRHNGAVSGNTTVQQQKRALPGFIHLLEHVREILELATFILETIHIFEEHNHKYPEPIYSNHIVCEHAVKCFETVLRDVQKKGDLQVLWGRLTRVEQSALMYAIGNQPYLADPPEGTDVYKMITTADWAEDARAIMLPIFQGIGLPDAKAIFEITAYVFGYRFIDLVYLRKDVHMSGQFDTQGWPKKLRQRFSVCAPCQVQPPSEDVGEEEFDEHDGGGH